MTSIIHVITRKKITAECSLSMTSLAIEKIVEIQYLKNTGEGNQCENN